LLNFLVNRQPSDEFINALGELNARFGENFPVYIGFMTYQFEYFIVVGLDIFDFEGRGLHVEYLISNNGFKKMMS